MKKILIFVFLIIYVLFMYIAFIHQSDDINKVSNRALFKFSKEQFKKRNLKLSGIGNGGGKVPGKFHTLSLDFFTNDELTIESGRKLLIEVADEFIESINKDKELEKFLYPYPFNINNIELSISVSDPIQGHKYYPKGFTEEKKITYLILCDKKIRYYIHTNINDLMQKVDEESYEEALKILEKENNVLL